jgi:hypothetical protein
VALTLAIVSWVLLVPATLWIVNAETEYDSLGVPHAAFIAAGAVAVVAFVIGVTELLRSDRTGHPAMSGAGAAFVSATWFVPYGLAVATVESGLASGLVP